MSKMEDYLKTATISENQPIKSDEDMVNDTLNDHKLLIKQMAKVIEKATEISDEGTIDLIGAYIRELEKSSWMLNAWTKNSTKNISPEMANVK